MASGLPVSNILGREPDKDHPLAEAFIWEDGRQVPLVWNFAFGSNMNDKVLLRRRKIRVLESHPAVLANWRLVMDVPGVPFLEPSFGNITDSNGHCCHGVLRLMPLDDFENLVRSEGGGGHSDRGYELVVVRPQMYSMSDDKKDRSATMHADSVGSVAISHEDGSSREDCASAPAHTSKGRRTDDETPPPPDLRSPTPAVAFVLRRNRDERVASKRYMDLLRQGARQHGLWEPYCEFLEESPHFETPSIAKPLVFFMSLFIALVFMIVRFANRHKMDSLSKLLWLYLHFVFQPTANIIDWLTFGILSHGSTATQHTNPKFAKFTPLSVVSAGSSADIIVDNDRPGHIRIESHVNRRSSSGLHRVQANIKN